VFKIISPAVPYDRETEFTGNCAQGLHSPFILPERMDVGIKKVSYRSDILVFQDRKGIKRTGSAAYVK
jgi:hypothetical protein